MASLDDIDDMIAEYKKLVNETYALTPQEIATSTHTSPQAPTSTSLPGIGKALTWYRVNLEHIFVGTYQDNNDDMHAKGRAVNGNKRLTQEQVDEIRANPKTRRQDLANKFGVSVGTIKAIRSGSIWK